MSAERTRKKEVPRTNAAAEFSKYADLGKGEARTRRGSFDIKAVWRLAANLEKLWQDEENRGHDLADYAKMAFEGTGLTANEARSILYHHSLGRGMKHGELRQRIDAFRNAVLKENASKEGRGRNLKARLENAKRKRKADEKAFRSAYEKLEKKYRSPMLEELTKKLRWNKSRTYNMANELGLELCRREVAEALDKIMEAAMENGGKLPSLIVLMEKTGRSDDTTSKHVRHLVRCGLVELGPKSERVRKTKAVVKQKEKSKPKSVEKEKKSILAAKKKEEREKKRKEKAAARKLKLAEKRRKRDEAAKTKRAEKKRKQIEAAKAKEAERAEKKEHAVTAKEEEAQIRDGAAFAAMRLLENGMIPTHQLLMKVKDADELAKMFNELPKATKVRFFLEVAGRPDARRSKAEWALFENMDEETRGAIPERVLNELERRFAGHKPPLAKTQS